MKDKDMLIDALAVDHGLPPIEPKLFDNARLSGVYRSQHPQSYWSNGLFPTGFRLTLTMRFTENFLSYEGLNDTNPEKLYRNRFDATLDDKSSPIKGNARFNEVRIRQLSDREFQVLEQLDGDVVVGQYWCFSEDASTLMRWGVGKAPDGSSKAFFETFRRLEE